MNEVRMEEIAAIVVWYNPSEEDIANINSYMEVGIIIIVDNSREDNQERICFGQSHTKIVYKSNKRNEGLSNALNKGIRIAKSFGYNWFLLMDQDSCFQSGAIPYMIETVNNHNEEALGMIGPYHEIGRRVKKSPVVRQTKWLMTSGTLLNVRTYDLAGGYDESYFIDGADRDFCHRVIERGLLIFEDGRAVLNHKSGNERTAVHVIKYGWHSPDRYYHTIGSLYRLYANYHEIKYLFLIAFKVIKVVLLFDNKKEYQKYIIAAIKDTRHDLRNRGIERQSKRI